jgi:hypothetical protein
MRADLRSCASRLGEDLPFGAYATHCEILDEMLHEEFGSPVSGDRRGGANRPQSKQVKLPVLLGTQNA